MNTLTKRRVFAFILDQVFYAVILVFLFYIIHKTSDGNFDSSFNWYLAVFLSINVIISTILEGLQQKTFGKMILGIGIISTRFYKVNLPISLVRNVIKIILLPINVIMLLHNSRSETLHSKISNTEVINK